MMENRLKQTVKTFSGIVEAIEELEIVERETVSKIKAKLRLFDGSMLWAREVWIKGTMGRYSKTSIVCLERLQNSKGVSKREAHSGFG